MTEYLDKKIASHEVVHEFTGKKHFFKVSNGDKEHSVIIDASCDCYSMANGGYVQGKPCSHILAVLQDVLEKKDLTCTKPTRETITRRNECLSLVKVSNRKINDIRIGENEGKRHSDKKIEICKKLIDKGKSFVTEAMFNNGGRSDILVLDDFKAIEIVSSETSYSLIEKTNSYPKGLSIEIVRL